MQKALGFITSTVKQYPSLLGYKTQVSREPAQETKRHRDHHLDTQMKDTGIPRTEEVCEMLETSVSENTLGACGQPSHTL